MRPDTWVANPPVIVSGDKGRSRFCHDRALAMYDAWRDTVRAETMAKAEEEITQAELRRPYKVNYLEAHKLFGRVVAERLFPRVNGGRAVETPEETQEA